MELRPSQCGEIRGEHLIHTVAIVVWGLLIRRIFGTACVAWLDNCYVKFVYTIVDIKRDGIDKKRFTVYSIYSTVKSCKS